MNEFETVTFIFEQTTFRELIAWTSLVSAGAAAFASVGIWGGVIAMAISNAHRSRDAKEIRRSNDQRHEEFMATHREAMAVHKAAHEESMAALKELIRRTSGPSAPPPEEK